MLAIYFARIYLLSLSSWVGVVGLTENKATQTSLAGPWAELGIIIESHSTSGRLPGGKLVASYIVLIEYNNFAYYTIRVGLEMVEIWPK